MYWSLTGRRHGQVNLCQLRGRQTGSCKRLIIIINIFICTRGTQTEQIIQRRTRMASEIQCKTRYIHVTQ